MCNQSVIIMSLPVMTHVHLKRHSPALLLHFGIEAMAKASPGSARDPYGLERMRYRKYGLAGLARDDRSDRGPRRAITAELKEILEALGARKATLGDSRFASADFQDRLEPTVVWVTVSPAPAAVIGTTLSKY